jgi:hypothetical protein
MGNDNVLKFDEAPNDICQRSEPRHCALAQKG